MKGPHSYNWFCYTSQALLLQLLVVFTLCLYNPYSHFILLFPISGPTVVLIAAAKISCWNHKTHYLSLLLLP